MMRVAGMGARLSTLIGGVAVALALATGAARAGEWAQVSCVNPNGSAAPSQGWSGQSADTGLGASTITTCAPGSPMIANLSSAAAEPVYSYENLVYTPPAGSTVAGGSLDVLLSGEGGGTNATGFASIDEPDTQFPTHVLVFCAQGLGGCGANAGTLSGGTVSGSDFTGTYALPAALGGDVYVDASCGGSSGYSCDSGGAHGAWALAQVDSADILLQNGAVPTATGVTGTLVGGPASGTADVIFTAADSGGPGVYSVTASIDGTAVYSGTPDSNNGECVPVGSDGSALEFDYQQPCPSTESVTIPVSTTALKNGHHQLQVTATDAAGNTATVIDTEITVDNPVSHAPAVHRRGEVHARFVLAWDLRHHRTRLERVVSARLPAHGHLALGCLGRRCPRLRLRRERVSRVSRIWRELERTRFRRRQRLVITVSAPHRRPEPIELTFRDGRAPRVRLLRRAPRAAH